MPKTITFVNSDLSYAQINALEFILNEGMVIELTAHIDLRVLSGFLHKDILRFNNETQEYVITPYGIGSYCATILAKGLGDYKRIHVMLNRYTELFPE